MATGLPLTAQDALDPASACSLRPLWSMAAVTRPTVARGWDTGHRDDAACDLGVSAWASTFYTGSVPAERPDGLAAPSAGLVSSVSAGVVWANERFEVRLAPVVAYHQNDDVEVPAAPFEGYSPFSYPWRRFDWPTRHGDEAFTEVGLGATGVRANLGGWSVGLDAQAVRWGPSLRYPLLLSGYGPELPRVDLRTESPIDLGRAGTLDVNLLYARLDESDWFDDDPDNDARIMGGLMLAWSPDVFEGLEFGIAALHHLRADQFGAGDLFAFLRSPSNDDGDRDDGNAIAEYWVRWSNQDLGIDAWVEWGRDDSSRDFTNLVLEPELNSARTFGIRQASDWGSGQLSFHLETTVTRNTEPRLDQPESGRGIFYNNSDVRQGHTHRGQMLGAFIGAGGDAQFLEIAYRGATATALQFERMRWNVDVYAPELSSPLGDEGYDVEVVGRVLHERPVGALRARAEVEFGTRRNRFFLQDEPSWEGNTRLGLMLLWNR